MPLFTFEGIDGSGKTTQIHAVAEVLKSKGIDPIVTREPGGTELGKTIRDLIFNPETKIGATTTLLLFAADRAEHCHQVITPALRADRVILCDRFADSTLSYQGYGDREGYPESLAEIMFLTTITSKGNMPTLTFWLDIDPKLAIDRVKRRGNTIDQIESKSIEFHQRVQQGYESIAKNNPNRIVKIQASQPTEEITTKIVNHILEVIEHPPIQYDTLVPTAPIIQ